jgi:hypothetical protein
VNVQDNLQHQKMKKTPIKVWKVIRFNHMTIREVAEGVGYSKTMCHEILTENLEMHHVAAVPAGSRSKTK